MGKKKRRPIFSKFTSIRSAMLVSFSCLILLALLIFLLISLNYTKNTVFENSITNTSRLIGQVNYDIDSYIDYMENIASMVSESEDVLNYLFDENSSTNKKEEEKKRIIAQFKTVIDSRADIYNMAAVTNQGKGIVNAGADELNSYVNIMEQQWYKDAIDSKTGSALSSSHVQNAIKSSYKWVITLSKSLVNTRTGNKEGVFFIDLNYSSISNLCTNNKIGNKGYVFIIDRQGNLIYHPQQQLMYGGLKTEIIDQILAAKEDYLVTKDGEESKLYTMSTSEKTGWTVVGVAYTSELLKNNKQTQVIYVLAALLLLVGAMIFSSIIARGITKPIEELRDSMQKVEQGEFEEANIVVMNNNEIGSLSNSFNIMTKRIQSLMEQNIFEQKQKRKSELRALQSQINPHFLYNTLDSIIWMAEGKKNAEVVLMTSALAKLLRQSISNEEEQILLSQEIMMVKSYLTIQKMRYKDKLEYEVEVEPSIQSVRIIKLVLQPIVENAIYHGLKYKDTKGKLSIYAYTKEDKVFIEVKDNGVGMDQDTLEHIFDEHKVNYHSNGVGVYNVQKRLQLYYGNDCGVTYTSRVGIGTVATITIRIDGGEKNDAD